MFFYTEKNPSHQRENKKNMARLKKKINKNLYLAAQKGGTFSGPVFSGRISRQRGGFMTGLARNVVKGLIKNQVRKAGRHVARIGSKITRDIAAGQGVKAAVKKTVLEEAKNAFGAMAGKKIQKIHKKKRHAKKSHKKKKNQTNNMKGGRLSQIPRQTYSVMGKKTRSRNVFGD